MRNLLSRPNLSRKNVWYQITISVYLFVCIIILGTKWNQTCTVSLNFIALLSIWHPILDITSYLLKRVFPNAVREKPLLAAFLLRMEFIAFILWFTTFMFMAAFLFTPNDCKQASPWFYGLATCYVWVCIVLIIYFVGDYVYRWWTGKDEHTSRLSADALAPAQPENSDSAKLEPYSETSV